MRWKKFVKQASTGTTDRAKLAGLILPDRFT